MPSRYTLPPSVNAFFAGDPIGRERFAERARRQAKKRADDEAVAENLRMHGGYFVHPHQPVPPREEVVQQQLTLDLDSKSK
jgi:hypothetical protein